MSGEQADPATRSGAMPGSGGVDIPELRRLVESDLDEARRGGELVQIESVGATDDDDTEGAMLAELADDIASGSPAGTDVHRSLEVVAVTQQQLEALGRAHDRLAAALATLDATHDRGPR